MPTWFEKPATDDKETYSNVTTTFAFSRTLFHGLYCPEVRWAISRRDMWERSHGHVVDVASRFTEPHLGNMAASVEALSGSWLDSGVTALAVALLFAREASVTSASGDRVRRARVLLSATDCRVTIDTEWTRNRRGKTTLLRFEDGTRCIMGHHDGSAVLKSSHGDTLEGVALGRWPLERRYERMFLAYAADGLTIPAPKADGEIHRLLFDADGYLREAKPPFSLSPVV